MAEARGYSWKDPSGLARATFICLALHILLAIGMTVAAPYPQPAFLSAGDASAAVADLPRLSLLLAIVGFAGLLLYVPGFIWFFRVSVNAHAIGPNMKHSPAGAVGWHFLPLANLVMPYLVMAEIWRVSAPDDNMRSLKVWWGLYALGFVVTLVIGAMSGLDLMDAFTTQVINVGLSVVSALAFIWAVASLTRLQSQMAAVSVFSDP
jgi:hypothetical protein